ncbi:MAG: hypothetical protein WAL50_09605, partial [Kineosporiaceae bacterium]
SALARLRGQTADTARAADAARHAAAVGDPAAWTMLAGILEQAGDPKGGAQIHRYGITVNGDPEHAWW